MRGVDLFEAPIVSAMHALATYSSADRWLRGRRMNVLLQLFRGLASQDVQHNSVRNQFRLVGILLQSRSQGGLCLRQPTEMEFCHGLTNDREGRGGARSGCQFLVDVECSLVFLAALKAEATAN